MLMTLLVMMMIHFCDEYDDNGGDDNGDAYDDDAENYDDYDYCDVDQPSWLLQWSACVGCTVGGTGEPGP